MLHYLRGDGAFPQLHALVFEGRGAGNVLRVVPPAEAHFNVGEIEAERIFFWCLRGMLTASVEDPRRSEGAFNILVIIIILL